MRHYHFALLFFFIAAGQATTTQAASIRWRNDTQKAVQEARGSGKPLLIEISTDWCHYCKKMDRETFSDHAIAEHISQCFVPLKLDGDADQAIVKRLGVQSFPTMVVLSPDMKIVTSIRGFRTSKQLSGELESLCSHADRPATLPKTARLSVFGKNCPVTSLSTGQAVKGTPEYQLRYNGFDLLFASDDARVMFDRNPDRYWPIVNGACVVTGLETNQLEFGKWEHSATWGGRIWLFNSAENRDLFLAKPDDFYRRLREHLAQGSARQGG